MAMSWYLENVSPTYAQMPNRNKNAVFKAVSPAIANTMLAVLALSLLPFPLVI